MRKELSQYLSELEEKQDLEFLMEAHEIRKILAPVEELNASDEKAEAYAFSFHQNVDNANVAFGVYYGISYCNGEDEATFPDARQVDKEMISYWLKRADETKNTILRCRYLSLATEFMENDQKRAARIQDTVNAIIQLLSEQRSINFVILKEYGLRSLVLAHFTSNKSLLEKVVAALTDYSKRFPESANLILTTISSHKAIKKQLSSDQLKNFVGILESFVESICSTDGMPVVDLTGIVITLCNYYRQTKSGEKIRNILKKMEHKVREVAASSSRAAVKNNTLIELYDIYGMYREYEFAKERQASIQKELTDMKQELEDDMQKYEYKYTLTDKEKQALQEWAKKLFENGCCKKTLKSVCTKIVLEPRRSDVEAMVHNSTQVHPLFNFFNTEIIGDYGLTTCILEQERPEDRITYEYTGLIKFMEPVYYVVMKELRKYFKYSDFVELLQDSGLCRPEDKLYVERMAQYFWEKDYFGFSALAIPLIESIFREVNRQKGRNIFNAKANENGGYDVVALGTLCDNEETRAIFGNDFIYFCNTLLLSPYGLNLRNNFCHGLNKTAIGDPSVAFRLMYILLVLCSKDIHASAEDAKR